ncbi:MAG: thioredoxin domain-containing protein [Chloroflexi bacterium]|nr:thioredoxin domain-containing protein [Chloroflexota bacterium]
MPNRLIDETSPYLLQHAHNPVEWYPWGEAALSKARTEDKPIFLSIGYAACHWCHVMEHESFEDETTARVMNELFVNIKVDREERLDLDSIYMSAVVGLTGSGGWPMSVFLTPDGKPFYGGTYFPPTPRHGMPSFRDVLKAVADAWQNRREDILKNSDGILGYLKQTNDFVGQVESQSLSTGTLTKAEQLIGRGFDRINGGWGGAPKFPQPMTLEFLLRRYTQTHDAKLRTMIDQTLRTMARGGMYDQLGGGFHRYSTDAQWLVPHFEKMLYDNSQLARVYLHAAQALNDPFYRRIAVEILDFVAREMTHPDGGFYSTRDADSEGVEGKFFVWTVDDVRSILGDDEILFSEVYGVTSRGNFSAESGRSASSHEQHLPEGQNILSMVKDPIDVAQANGLSPIELETILGTARQKLFDAREGRVKPQRDEKVLSAWNGLMLAAFAEAARDPALADRAQLYRSVAEHNAEFLLRELRSPNGRLLRTWKDGRAKLNAYLEDYAAVIEGLIELYQTIFDERWFVAARELADVMLQHFSDPAGGFFDTSDDHEALVTRPKDLQDNAVPSGNALAATVLLKLYAFTGDDQYYKQAELMLGILQGALAQAPTGFAQWLCALDFALSDPCEIAIVGDVQSGAGRALLAVVREGYRPNQVIAARPGDRASQVPLLADRPAIGGQATAYVCRNFACRQPVTEPAGLRAQLE